MRCREGPTSRGGKGAAQRDRDAGAAPGERPRPSGARHAEARRARCYVPVAAMTVGYCPAFDPKIPAHFEGDGAALFHHAAALDAIAEERGVPLLTSFADDREPPPDFDGYPEELVEAIGPWTAWFSPNDGLRCVEGLLEALDEPEARARIPAVETVVDDLTALHEVLLLAKKKKARFRLEIA